MRLSILFALSVFTGCASNEESKTIDTIGSCTHLQSSVSYSGSACTGATVYSKSYTYCTETTDTSTCKTYTSCSNGFYYSDLQSPNTNKGCTAAGFPLACSGGSKKVSSLDQCP